MDRERIRRFYDRMGSGQDSQGFYEDAAIDALVDAGSFATARSVLEVGCGTGKLAARLLSAHLPGDAHYRGLDISDTMVGLARARVAPWTGRAEVVRTLGDFEFAAGGAGYDRILLTYVFDLLDPRDIDACLHAGHAALRPGGLLCSAGLTDGIGPLSRMTSTLWALVHRAAPMLVGGCRPLVLAERLPVAEWRITHRRVVVSATVPSEVIVAEAL